MRRLAYWLEGDLFNVASSRNVISSAELDGVSSAVDLFERAEHRARDIVDSARLTSRRAEKKGYAAGYDAAMQQFAQKRLELELHFRQQQAEMQQQVAGFVVDCLKKMLGEIGPDHALAARALAIVRSQVNVSPLLVRVHPAKLGEVRSALEGAFGELQLNLSLEGDPRVGHADVWVQAGETIIRGVLAIQLQELFNLLKVEAEADMPVEPDAGERPTDA
ncbi:Flagellar biosynthesis/type III secretory pathway protein FliH [Noviherbaspirillum humi]|uniref:Flagellar biosynthesis/type III secretory pathway protein FliH n=1 Tax=Noviherbaspirillum humi TaxID=1688639 RepID=A0A239K087_9BURK|nr:HrpE/YscL family type III secretion apparatus protein [Noviherbaspirillum humi]SNT10464.1 Flagellar biosynthesis/type III secretory pathway protein FliH [Noviherbaspirillum humi]